MSEKLLKSIPGQKSEIPCIGRLLNQIIGRFRKQAKLVIDETKLVGLTIQEMLDQIRKETGDHTNDQSQLIVAEVRHSFAFAITDGEDFVLINRAALPDITAKNQKGPYQVLKNDEVPMSDHSDLPVASRAIVPDSPFKTPTLAGAVIKQAKYIGTAVEHPKGVNDANTVEMPIMLLTVTKEERDKMKNLAEIQLLTAQQIQELGIERITGKVAVLQEYLKEAL